MPSTVVPDVFDPRVFGAGIPHEALRHLRDTTPVAWQEEHAVGVWPAGPGFWAVTRHADVRHVLRSPEDFSSALGATQIRDPDPADLPFLRRMVLNMDPPEQVRLRALAAGAFTRRRLERFRDTVATRAAALLDAAIEAGHADLPRDVTDVLPLANLCDLLGVPAADRGLLKRWTDRVIGYQDPEHAVVVTDAEGRPVNPRSPAQLADMFAFADELAARKRAEPADDLMSALVEAGLTGPELQMFFFLLVIAGNDTVRSALPGGVALLTRHSEADARLRADPALLPSAIEEMLRLHPPVLTFRRTAARDVELGGSHIRRGDKVVVYHVSANVDERRFPDPLTFDVTRTPNEHVAFGQGPHLCLGAAFARLQMTAFFTAWLARPRPEPDGEPRRLVSNFINGLVSLPLRW
jgi:cytochrome P450